MSIMYGFPKLVAEPRLEGGVASNAATRAAEAALSYPDAVLGGDSSPSLPFYPTLTNVGRAPREQEALKIMTGKRTFDELGNNPLEYLPQDMTKNLRSAIDPAFDDEVNKDLKAIVDAAYASGVRFGAWLGMVGKENIDPEDVSAVEQKYREVIFERLSKKSRPDAHEVDLRCDEDLNWLDWEEWMVNVMGPELDMRDVR